MFLNRGAFCPCCNQKKDIACHSGNHRAWCGDCIQAEADTKYLTYRASCDKLTLEQRVHTIEDWIYNHQENPPRSYSDIVNTPLG